MLAVAENFVMRGDDVRFVTGSRYADKAAATGATFVPWLADADFDFEESARRFPERAKLKGLKATTFDLENVLARPAKAQYETLMAALAAQPADVVLAEPPILRRRPHARTPTPRTPGRRRCARLSRWPTRVATPLRSAWVCRRPVCSTGSATPLWRRSIAGSYGVPIKRSDDQYREVHGKEMPGTMFDWGRRADALVQFSVPSFEYPRSDAPGNLHYIGPLSATGSPAPLPDWWDDLDGTRPVVHVTQGTVANIDYEQAIAPTLRALADEDVLVVVATGGRPLDTLPAAARQRPRGNVPAL